MFRLRFFSPTANMPAPPHATVPSSSSVSQPSLVLAQAPTSNYPSSILMHSKKLNEVTWERYRDQARKGEKKWYWSRRKDEEKGKMGMSECKDATIQGVDMDSGYQIWKTVPSRYGSKLSIQTWPPLEPESQIQLGVRQDKNAKNCVAFHLKQGRTWRGHR